MMVSTPGDARRHATMLPATPCKHALAHIAYIAYGRATLAQGRVNATRGKTPIRLYPQRVVHPRFVHIPDARNGCNGRCARWEYERILDERALFLLLSHTHNIGRKDP
jgi:hypothetical protein